MKKGFRITITILIIVVIAGMIFYPKIKPVLSSKTSQQDNPGPGRVPGSAQGRQLLSVSGFLIKPVKMSDPINTVGTLWPDEEVDLSFETSGKSYRLNAPCF